MVFERKSYLEQLHRADGNGMIKVITGIRRCGKSYLLFNLFYNDLLGQGINEEHIIKVNLEDRRNKKLRDPDALLQHIDGLMKDAGKYYILLDEVQLVKEFEDVLNSYLGISNAEVYVTGSNAKFLSKDVITEFRGRGWEIRIHPLSFSEYYEAVGGELAVALDLYYKYGGLPAVAQFDRPEDKQNYLKEIYETVYLKDVLERNHLKNADAISDFLCYGDTGRQKEETIRMLMEKYDLKAPVYIGDTKGDAIASQKAGIPVIFASYGLGTMEKEDYIAKIDSLPELVTLLAGKKNLEMTL